MKEVVIRSLIYFCFCEARCGQLIYTEEDAARTLTSPGFHNDGYRNNMNCQYKIQAPTGYQIRARFVVSQSKMFLDQSLFRTSDESSISQAVVALDTRFF